MEEFSGEEQSNSSDNDSISVEHYEAFPESTSNSDETSSFKYDHQRVLTTNYSISNNTQDTIAMHQVPTLTHIIRRRLMLKLRLSETAVKAISPSELFMKALLTGKMMEILQEICNARLMQLNKPYCDENDIMSAVSVILAACFYGRSVTELLNPDNDSMYNIPDINKARIMLVIRCMEGEQIEITRSHHSNFESGDVDINKVEEEFSAIYTSIAYINEMDLSADDDLIRLRSKNVPNLTGLKQIHVPNKGMGCVQTTVACPLTNVTLCSRYSVKEEPYVKTLEILLKRIQNEEHDHLVDFQFLSTIFLDRGYVSEEVVKTLNRKKINLIGIRKKGKSSPFAIGDNGGINQKIQIRETGITAEFWAGRKWCSGVVSHHLALREERLSGGKIVSLITTRSDLGYGNRVIKSNKPGAVVGEKHMKVPLDYDKLSDVSALIGNIGEEQLNRLEDTIQPLTEKQSTSDKLWFVARALHHTSTVGLGFLRILARKCPSRKKIC